MRNVHGSTVEHLGAAIVAGHYAVQASIPPEPLLGQQLGVSRTVVREAVKSLVAKGLLSSGPKVGTRVLAQEHWNWFDADVVAWQSKAGLTPQFVRDLLELRRAIEPAAVRLAAERASAADIAEIEDAYRGMQRATLTGSHDYVRHDLRFHQGLLRACGNRMLAQMGRALEALLRTGFEVSTRRKGGAATSLPMHRAVLDAVIARRPAEAERAVLELIDTARHDIEQVLAAPAPAAAPPSRLARPRAR